MKLTDIQPLSQRDSRWANKLLGFNTHTWTIGGWGCLITCLSMITDDAVDFMNVRLKDIDGFVNGGFYVWGSLSRLYPDIKEYVTTTPESLTNVQLSEIREALDNGCPVMLQIDMVPETAETDMHYVLCVAYNPNDDNGFTILDPWTGEARSIKDYLRDRRKTVRSSIEQYIIYRGVGFENTQPEAAEGPPRYYFDEKIAELGKKVKELREQRTTHRAEMEKLQSQKQTIEEECAKKKVDNKEHVKRLLKTLSETNLSAITANKQLKDSTKRFDEKLESNKEITSGLSIEADRLGKKLVVKEKAYVICSAARNEMAEEIKELKKKVKQKLNKHSKMELLKSIFFSF